MRSELLVAHGKLGQFLLLTEYAILIPFETAPFFCVCPVFIRPKGVYNSR
jgi:hypothetical protein